MMKMTGLSHLLKWENLHNWWLTKYFFAPLYIRVVTIHRYGLIYIVMTYDDRIRAAAIRRHHRLRRL